MGRQSWGVTNKGAVGSKYGRGRQSWGVILSMEERMGRRYEWGDSLGESQTA